jgi:hypothetical protein
MLRQFANSLFYAGITAPAIRGTHSQPTRPEINGPTWRDSELKNKPRSKPKPTAVSTRPENISDLNNLLKELITQRDVVSLNMLVAWETAPVSDAWITQVMTVVAKSHDKNVNDADELIGLIGEATGHLPNVFILGMKVTERDGDSYYLTSHDLPESGRDKVVGMIEHALTNKANSGWLN